MANENDNQNQEEEIIPVEDEDLSQESSSSSKDDDADDELDEEEGQEESEARLGASEDDDEDGDRKAIRQRRRGERKQRRQRQKENRDRNFRELEFLRNRNETLERKFSEVEARVDNSEVSAIGQRIEQVKSQLRLADDVMAKAVEAQAGEDLVEAQNIRDGLRDNLRDLQTAERAYRDKPLQAPEVDTRVQSHANSFMTEHEWWDPKGGDEDSRIVSAIDNGLVGEGYDPTTQDYWDELADRVQDRLPHRFKADSGDGRSSSDDDGSTSGKRGRPGGPTFRSRGQDRPLKKNEVYVSPERKEAMIEAGVWEDPTLRQRYLKQYAAYDRAAG